MIDFRIINPDVSGRVFKVTHILCERGFGKASPITRSDQNSFQAFEDAAHVNAVAEAALQQGLLDIDVSLQRKLRGVFHAQYLQRGGQGFAPRFAEHLSLH